MAAQVCREPVSWDLQVTLAPKLLGSYNRNTIQYCIVVIDMGVYYVLHAFNMSSCDE